MIDIHKYNYIGFACIDSKLDKVMHIIQEKVINKDPDRWEKLEIKNFEQVFYSFYTLAPPMGANYKTKVLLWQPFCNKDTTIFFSNVSDGWHTLLYNIALKNIPLYKVSFGNQDHESVANIFKYMSGKIERVVQSIKEDNKWVFAQKGEALEIEDIDNYNKRMIKDRINKNIIISYLKKLGWDILSENFWKSNTNILIKER